MTNQVPGNISFNAMTMGESLINGGESPITENEGVSSI
jgi:hypothetical protein